MCHVSNTVTARYKRGLGFWKHRLCHKRQVEVKEARVHIEWFVWWRFGMEAAVGCC
jgi:hypothetical protein